MSLANITQLEPFNINSAASFSFANITSSGNITASYLVGNGSQITGLPASYANSNVASYLPTYSGNLTATNVAFTGSNVSLGEIGNLHITGGSANYVLSTDGSGTLAWVAQSGGGANIASSAPTTASAGSLWYDNVNTGELYVYDGNSWVSTSIVPLTSLNAPTLTSPSSANESSIATISITNYNAAHAYLITTSGGTATRSGSTISWTLPDVSEDTSHYITVQAVSGGVATSIETRTITVLSVEIVDAAVIVSDFSYNTLNTGWTT